MAAHATTPAPYEYHLVFGAHPDEAHFTGARIRAPHVARVFVDRLAPVGVPRGEHHDLFVQHDFNHTWSLPGAILDAFEYARIVFYRFHEAGTPLPALPMKL